jgi:hypothetical protein
MIVHEWKYGQGRRMANEAAGKIDQGVGKAAGSDKLPGERRCNFLVGCSQPTLNQRCFSMVPAGAGSSIRGKA